MDLNLIPLAARFNHSHARVARTESEQVARHAAAFGVFDAKGREIGHRYAIDREVHVIDAESHTLCELSRLDLLLEESFIVYPQGLRDGVKFGALPTASRKRFKTLAEAQAYADDVIKRASKSAAKKASA